MAAVYYLGYPAAVTAVLAIVLWVVMQDVNTRIEHIEFTLTTETPELLSNQKVIIQQNNDQTQVHAQTQVAISKGISDLTNQLAVIQRRLDDVFMESRIGQPPKSTKGPS